MVGLVAEMSDVKVLMSMFVIDAILIFGMFDYVKHTASIKCSNLASIASSLEGIETKTENVEFETDESGRMLSEDEKGSVIETGTNMTAQQDEDNPIWSKEWVCSIARSNQEKYEASGDLISAAWWRGQAQICEAQEGVSNFWKSVTSRVSSFITTISKPVSQFITLITISIKYPQCTGIPSIVFLFIFAPMFIGILYIVSKLIRGSG